MIAYLDASALVKRYLVERGSRETIALMALAGRLKRVLAQKSSGTTSFCQECDDRRFTTRRSQAKPRRSTLRRCTLSPLFSIYRRGVGDPAKFCNQSKRPRFCMPLAIRDLREDANGVVRIAREGILRIGRVLCGAQPIHERHRVSAEVLRLIGLPS